MVVFMTKENLPPIVFARPDIGDEEIAALVHCVRSGWLTTGPNAAQFEKDFSDYMGGAVSAVSVNSCTAGLLLALKALGIVEGDEVITSTWTFTATAMTIYHAGAKPVLVDVDPVTLNMDPERVEAAVTSRTRAIIPVHFAGLACNMDAIGDIAKRHGLKVIEDAAHALPTTYRGRLIGSGSADATVFSFYATKTITTGEGGMVTTTDPEVAQKCRTLRLHGIDRDVFRRYSSTTASWRYEVVAPGYKCNLTDMAAALGIVQLKRLGGFLERRREIKRRYHEAFANLPLDLPVDAPDGDVHAWHLYVVKIRADAPVDRDGFIRAMNVAGIGCSVHFIPCHLHPFWAETLRLQPSDLPNALATFERVVSLPFYTAMTDGEVERVIETVRSILSGR